MDTYGVPLIYYSKYNYIPVTYAYSQQNLIDISKLIIVSMY